MEGCPLKVNDGRQEVPARCAPCVRSVLSMKGTTVATETFEYDSDKDPYYAEWYEDEKIAAIDSPTRNRRLFIETGTRNPDNGEIFQRYSSTYISFNCWVAKKLALMVDEC